MMTGEAGGWAEKTELKEKEAGQKSEDHKIQLDLIRSVMSHMSVLNTGDDM